MARKRVISSIVAGGAALGAYIFSDENRRGKFMNQYNKMKDRLFNNDDKDTLEKAGNPESKAEHENSKMVSEGSQFGVQYYNEVKEEDKQKQ
ncbi:hypothetical protein E3U55_05860 [Filobacillus milosensis]|uniref:YtxH domain-containing protein n=1 Tax=Filobacillus milosensis TaxID=94137 RepID=A0A4Y8IT96_9BACI|nr:hypothetical protein [Filobacillus milosensis]TFB23340.1 hypothetical protein E3U55_05860 [Filobacillus milosensis]